MFNGTHVTIEKILASSHILQKIQMPRAVCPLFLADVCGENIKVEIKNYLPDFLRSVNVLCLNGFCMKLVVYLIQNNDF